MTTTSTHETEIILDTEVPLIRIIREFDAPTEMYSGPTPILSFWSSGQGRGTRR
jgi:hypothetical protein